jgi:hypothetical protein
LHEMCDRNKWIDMMIAQRIVVAIFQIYEKSTVL